jgi:hypothetical protein
MLASLTAPLPQRSTCHVILQSQATLMLIQTRPKRMAVEKAIGESHLSLLALEAA